MLTLTFTDEQARALDAFATIYKNMPHVFAASRGAKAWLEARTSGAQMAIAGEISPVTAAETPKRHQPRTPAQVEAARNLRPGYKRRRKLAGQQSVIEGALEDGLSGPQIAAYFKISVTTLYHSPEWKAAQEAAGVARVDNFNEINRERVL